MARQPPDFFAPIQQVERAHWETLEAQPRLAAPWHQLFGQIKSPRHVLSELLQNADDAQATQAEAWLAPDGFYFRHDGADFDAANFESLCSFGHSNKRHLHTIGFRGLGFKSVFSLGPRVEVLTPSLSIAFEEPRFTFPVWLSDAPTTQWTEIRVGCQVERVRQMLTDQLSAWAASPIPLLFFRHIQKLTLQGITVSKRLQSQGPTPNSQWVTLSTPSGESQVLLAETKPLRLPAEAVAEIRAERQATAFEEMPQVKVQIVLEAPEVPTRAYVVLPTEVRWALPFSCNAPFLQDPARTGLKDPTLSPTNHWLLQQVGDLAGATLLAWLNQTTQPLAARAQAYRLLPPAKLLDAPRSVPDDCARLICVGLQNHLHAQPLVLDTEGGLGTVQQALDIPAALLEVWPAETLLSLFGNGENQIVAAEVTPKQREKLASWQQLKRQSDVSVRQALCQRKNVPRPAHDEQLFNLWVYAADNWLNTYLAPPMLKTLNLVPVQGLGTLEPAETTLLLGGTLPEALSPDDWQFLMQYIKVVDLTWAKQRTLPPEPPKDETPATAKVREVFKRLGLDAPVSLQRLIEETSKKIFTGLNPAQACLRMTEIAFSVGYQPAVQNYLKFQCLDDQWRAPSANLVAHADEALLPHNWLRQHAVKPTYWQGRSARQAQDWLQWAQKCGVRQFPAPTVQHLQFKTRSQFEHLCRERGGFPPATYPYKNSNYQLDDYDFDSSLWAHWEKCAQGDAQVWAQALRQLSPYANEFITKYKASQAHQKTGNGNSRPLNCGTLTAGWLMQLRTKPCLLDTYRRPAYPTDQLFRTTAETAPLQDLERFVHSDLDTGAMTGLLDALGVLSKPLNAQAVIKRLQAQAQTPTPHLQAVISLYRLLDRLIVNLDAPQVAQLQQLFRQEKLIFTDTGGWQTAVGVARQNAEALPGVLAVLPELCDLPLWDRLKIEPQPQFEQVLAWVKTLPVGEPLKDGDDARLRDILTHDPQSVWDVCQAWLDVERRWVALAQLGYYTLSQQAGIKLFPHIRSRVADVSMLNAPLPAMLLVWQSLAEALQTQLSMVKTVGHPTQPEWLHALGEGLARVDWAKRPGVSPEHMQAEVVRLRRTQWQMAERLEVTQTLDQMPASAPQSQRVLWLAEMLYVVGEGGRLHRPLAEGLGQPFGHKTVRDAIANCIERPPAWIMDYLQENFDLLSEPVWLPPAPEAPAEVLPPLPNLLRPPEALPEAPPMEADAPPPAPAAPREPGERSAPGFGKRDLFAHYMRQHGFTWHEHRKVYVHASGQWVAKAEAVFDWHWHTREGHSQAYFWVSTETLDKGVELPTEVQEVCQRQPEMCWLVFADAAQQPEAYSWRTLQTAIKARQIELFSATVRLRRLNDD